ncbi:MAG: hypothetical protein IPJ65_40560 [Archangiaceae bacterium]|nr:hypothetical protein [Archangiaceae bacterium]
MPPVGARRNSPFDAWLRQLAPAAGPAKRAAAAAALEQLETTGYRSAGIRGALEPLALDSSALDAAVARFKDDFAEVVRPDPGANFFDPKSQVTQAAWHAEIKRAAVDPISGKRLTPQAVAASAQVPKPRPMPLSADELKGLLELGPTYQDGNAVELNPTAKKLATLLESRAREALGTPNFDARNLISAEVIAFESAVLAAASAEVREPAQVDALYQLFFKAAFEAGNAFRPAFTPDGQKSAAPDADALRTEAQKAAGGIAYRALPELVTLLGVTNAAPPAETARKVILGAAIEDVATVASGDLHLSYFPTAEKIAETLKEIVSPDDYFFSEIDKLQNRGDDQKVLSLAVRLANTTWKAGQVHRAAWEGTDKRIDPRAGDRLGVFNPYDNLKADMYNATFAHELERGEGEGLPRQAALSRASERGFARVVFEIYKDLVELKKAAAAPTDG